MILVFGRTGQVATALRRQAAVTALGRRQADLRDPEACADAIRAHMPWAVINAAAYTDVDGAEAEEALASVVNAGAPHAMAEACAEMGVPFVQLSTDYVFDGSGTAPWTVDAAPGPLGVYGRSKLAGEKAVRAAGGAHAVLRTSWVFSARDGNFVTSVLHRAAAGDRLRVVADQVGGPTPAAAVAAVCLRMARTLCEEPEKTGIYHLSGGPDVSRSDFARAILARAGMRAQVIDIPTACFPAQARRPRNSRLDNTALTRAFGGTRPGWRRGLAEVLIDLGAISR
ncbi:MAG: dTDP-4-dehydrorhamnose reductase [Pseudomonadota bacterium]